MAPAQLSDSGRPSANRDFPPGCGRNAEDLSRSDDNGKDPAEQVENDHNHDKEIGKRIENDDDHDKEIGKKVENDDDDNVSLDSFQVVSLDSKGEVVGVAERGLEHEVLARQIELDNTQKSLGLRESSQGEETSNFKGEEKNDEGKQKMETSGQEQVHNEKNIIEKYVVTNDENSRSLMDQNKENDSKTQLGIASLQIEAKNVSRPRFKTKAIRDPQIISKVSSAKDASSLSRMPIQECTSSSLEDAGKEFDKDVNAGFQKREGGEEIDMNVDTDFRMRGLAMGVDTSIQMREEVSKDVDTCLENSREADKGIVMNVANINMDTNVEKRQELEKGIVLHRNTNVKCKEEAKKEIGKDDGSYDKENLEIWNSLQELKDIPSSSKRKLDEYELVEGVSNKKQRSTPSSKKKSSGKKTKVSRIEDIIGEDVSRALECRMRAKNALIIYDAVRRHTAAVKGSRPDQIAGTLMMKKGMWLFRDEKFVGHVPGVEIGDIFCFRYELCIVGLHSQIQAGIDFVGARNTYANDSFALCIIDSGGYQNNEENDGEKITYTGSGGGDWKEEQEDQKLERGNLALENSIKSEIVVRVVKGCKDSFSPSGKVYTYVGLYQVLKSWQVNEKPKGRDKDVRMWKYELRRVPGQRTQMIDRLRFVDQWKKDVSSRGNLILGDLSSTLEKLRVALVNDYDKELGPSPFEYRIAPVFPENLERSLDKTLHQRCDCRGGCDVGCPCLVLNGNKMPYTPHGTLVRWRPLIYECGKQCKCPPTCKMKLSQKGLRFYLEVFRNERGWGVRSWDPITAGSFICEYIGDVSLSNEQGPEEEEDDEDRNQYILNANLSQVKSTNWGSVAWIMPEVELDSSLLNPIDVNYYLNSRYNGNVSRFITHSKDPNVLLQAVLFDHHDTRFPHMMLFAKEHIPPFTELTLDYGLD